MVTEIVDAPTQPASSDIVVHQGADLVPARSTSSLVQLTAPMADIVQAQAQYQEVCRALLDPNDIQMIGQREFKKKSAWRKLGVAFGVSTQILSTTHERNERGRITRTEVVARATAPNGRFAEGIGACDLYERCCDPETCTKKTHWEDSGRPTGHVHCTEWPCKNVHFSNPQHDIPATAATRATNRAAADLFGMGEVSAEEMTDNGSGERAQDHADQPGQSRQSGGQTDRPPSDKQLNFLNSLLSQTGMDMFDLKDVIGRDLVTAAEVTGAEAKKAIDHLIAVKDGKAPRPPEPQRRSTADGGPVAAPQATDQTGNRPIIAGQIRAIESLLKRLDGPAGEDMATVSIAVNRQVARLEDLTFDEAGLCIDGMQLALTKPGEEQAF